MFRKLQTIYSTYDKGGFFGLFRFILVKEREKRESFIHRFLSWYYKQIVIEKCDHVGKNLFVGPRPVEISQREDSKIIIGDNVNIYGPCQLVATKLLGKPSCLRIGDNTNIGRYTSIRSTDSITIGNHCLIARHVRIIDNNAHPLNPIPRLRRERIPENEIRPITISDNVWIGENSFVLPGVEIGYGSVIGANSVVTKDIPAYKIAFGNPARVAGWLKEDYRCDE